ncbi:MAG: Death on curing protein, Doc toxin [uncultured Sulfurovum sp.]|uniref:Death on curing protein, Doc toxin n=1 Tax=uncultured Sulfurovum sp. TaxID=269237 RepID=A0A6S6TEY8_9BACT|nr:MAG: Death on curing protein, Doc toxin [uncultured Sulfurovum sp.]
MVIIDTCILIDYSKDKIEISEDEFVNCYVNSIIQLELLFGALNKRELKKLNKILAKCQLLDVDQEIMSLSVELMNRYGLSHGMGVYDAIIAATCMVYDLPLWTHNKKDFQFLDIDFKM